MFDVTELLEEIKASPYEEIVLAAPHTGVITFGNIQEGHSVYGPSGMWKEKPGTLMASIEREHNLKPIYAHQKGQVCAIERHLEGQFVEAGTPLLTIRHFLSKDEVLKILLQKALHLFPAPERAKYYFTPQVDVKIKNSNCTSVTVTDGMELFIMSRMKRELPLYYTGPEGVIYGVYFKHNENVDAGAPLIGICPQHELATIEGVVRKVQTEWKETE